MAENIVSEVGGNIADKVFSGLLWFGVAVIVIMIVGFLMWYYIIYKKKFNIEVKLTSERAGGEIVEIIDKAAILRDRKEGTPYLRVWGLKRDFVVPKYNVLRNLYKGGKTIDYLEIYRKGENEFYFLLPPTIDNRRIVKEDGEKYLLADQKQLMMDPEMAFWAVKRKSLNKKMIDTESLLWKLLPYMGILLGGVILIFILYLLLDHLPGILAELTKLVSEMRLMQRAEIVTSAAYMLPLFLKWKFKED